MSASTMHDVPVVEIRPGFMPKPKETGNGAHLDVLRPLLSLGLEETRSLNMAQIQTTEQPRRTPFPFDRKKEVRVPMSYADYTATIEDSLQSEWVNGEATIFVPHTIRHQEVAGFLSFLLNGFVLIYDLGSVFMARTEMHLPIGGDFGSRISSSWQRLIHTVQNL